MAEVRLHVLTVDGFFERAAQAARRIDADDNAREAESPASEIAFESMDLLLKALTANRWRLLRALKVSGPGSIRQLARTLGRDYRGVHFDVTALIEIGLIEKAEGGAIHVPWDRIIAEMAITEAA